jgi:hypothetical protein
MGSTFIPSRCGMMDVVGSNVLIRGNMPLIEPDFHFAYEEIQIAIGLNLSSMSKFIEVPIIDNNGEREQFEQIFSAFGVSSEKYPESFWPWWEYLDYNPNELQGSTLKTEGTEKKGSLIWRPFEGLPENTDPKIFLKSPGWDFDGFICNLINLMKNLKNTAIYVHCQLGADRTGAAHIGYLMKSKRLNLELASKIANSSTSAGAPNADYQRLVEAYSKII